VIFADASLVSLLDEIRGELKNVRQTVALDDDSEYEKMLAESPGEPYPWPDLDENEACATCYTSGTTGHPKGVL